MHHSWIGLPVRGQLTMPWYPQKAKFSKQCVQRFCELHSMSSQAQVSSRALFQRRLDEPPSSVGRRGVSDGGAAFSRSDVSEAGAAFSRSDARRGAGQRVRAGRSAAAAA